MSRSMRAGAVAFVGSVALTLSGALGGGCRQIIGLEQATLWDGGAGGGTAASTGNASPTGSASSSGIATSSSSGAGGMPAANGTACTMNDQCASNACVDDGQGNRICCATKCAGNLACAPGGTCQTACTVDGGNGGECATGTTCSMGTCLLGNGQACAMGSECASTYCADGVCCNTACNNAACYACTAKFTGGVDGTCSPVTDGSLDPHGKCGPDPVKTCGYDGKCVASACEAWPIGTVCSSGGCNGSVSLLECSSTGQCDHSTGSVSCPSHSCTALGGNPGETCSCMTASDCPAPLPNCVIVTGLPCPACMTGQQCCEGVCQDASTPCHDGSGIARRRAPYPSLLDALSTASESARRTR